MAGCKLTYFDLPGRAAVPRYALFKAFGKDGWTDERINGETFAKMKAEGSLPLNGLPVLTLKDGTVMSQSGPIARWAGKQAGLYPDDLTEALKVEEAMDTFAEIVAKCPHDPDPEQKKKKREEFAQAWMKSACTMLEKRYAASDASPFLLKEMTLVDLALYTFVQGLLEGFFDYIPGTYIDDFPTLKAGHQAVKDSDFMKKYYESYKN